MEQRFSVESVKDPWSPQTPADLKCGCQILPVFLSHELQVK